MRKGWDDAYLNSEAFLQELRDRAATYRRLRLPRAAERIEESAGIVEARLRAAGVHR